MPLAKSDSATGTDNSCPRQDPNGLQSSQRQQRSGGQRSGELFSSWHHFRGKRGRLAGQLLDWPGMSPIIPDNHDRTGRQESRKGSCRPECSRQDVDCPVTASSSSRTILHRVMGCSPEFGFPDGSRGWLHRGQSLRQCQQRLLRRQSSQDHAAASSFHQLQAVPPVGWLAAAHASAEPVVLPRQEGPESLVLVGHCRHQTRYRRIRSSPD